MGEYSRPLPMSTDRVLVRLRPIIIPDRKDVQIDSPPALTGGHLSPDLQPNTPPAFPGAAGNDGDAHHSNASRIGDYLLLDVLETHGSVSPHGPVAVLRALHTVTHEELTCKVRGPTLIVCNQGKTRTGDCPGQGPVWCLVQRAVLSERRTFVSRNA